MVDTMIWYNIKILPFHIFVRPSPLLMCVTYPGLDPTGYDWLYSWFHGECVATAGAVYSSYAPITTLFPSVRVVFSVTFIPGFVMEMDYNDIWLTDDGRYKCNLTE